MPVYQSSAPRSLNVINGYSSGTPCGAGSSLCREVPDVAADADPAHGYLIFYNGSGSVSGSPSGWQATGGTSGASPLWAALFALADASKQCTGVPIGFANPALYRLAGAGQSSYFNDVTSGNNDYTGTQSTKYPATPGYDLATGLGSPNASALAGGLCSGSLRLGQPRIAAVTFAGSRVRVAVPVADGAGSSVSFSASGLPSGLSINPSSGVISGIARRAQLAVVTVSARDSYGDVRRLGFHWLIAARPRVATAILSSPSGGTGVLRLTVRAGRNEPALSRVTVVLPAGVRLSARAAGATSRLRFTVARGRSALLRAASRRGAVRATVRITDAGGGVTKLSARVRVQG
jgi:hypothetical protein